MAERVGKLLAVLAQPLAELIEDAGECIDGHGRRREVGRLARQVHRREFEETVAMVGDHHGRVGGAQLVRDALGLVELVGRGFGVLLLRSRRGIAALVRLVFAVGCPQGAHSS